MGKRKLWIIASEKLYWFNFCFWLLQDLARLLFLPLQMCQATRNQGKVKVSFWLSMKALLDAGDRGMAAGAGIALKWVMKAVVGGEWEGVRVEKEWAIGAGWDVGCIMVAEQADPHSAHSPEQL